MNFASVFATAVYIIIGVGTLVLGEGDAASTLVITLCLLGVVREIDWWIKGHRDE